MLALKTCMDPSKQCVECPFNDKEQACYALNAHMKDLNNRYGELIDEYREEWNARKEEQMQAGAGNLFELLLQMGR